MYNLTAGDIRYIGESTVLWWSTWMQIDDAMDGIPEEVMERLRGLQREYEERFSDFYQQELDRDGSKLSGEIQLAFERIWLQEHPEFYDVDRLLEGCSEEALKQAADAIQRAREDFVIA